MKIPSLAVATFLAAAMVDTINSFVIPGNICRHNTHTKMSHNDRPLLYRKRIPTTDPKSRDVNSRMRLGMISAFTSSSLFMADESIDNVTPSLSTPKLTRTQQRIEQLQADIQNAEMNRENVLQQLLEAEQRREQLEQEAARTLQEAQIRQEQLEKLQQSQAAAAVAVANVPIVAAAATAAIGGLAAARTVLQRRQEKLVEQQKRLQEERIVKERAALKAKRQQDVTGKFLLVSSVVDLYFRFVVQILSYIGKGVEETYCVVVYVV
jgi:hypothetical protein